MSDRRTRSAVRPVGFGALLLAALATLLGLTAVPATAHAGYGPVRPFDNVWGGYVAQGSGFGTITGSWTEPQVQCTSTQDVFAPWVGIDGYGSQTVEQTGVETNCENGSPTYRAWYEIYPDPPVYFGDPVGAGDRFTGTVTSQGGGSYDITLTDSSRGWTEHTTQYIGGSDVSAEAVIESPSGSYPSFSELDFSGITVDGQVFDAYSPQGIDSGGYAPTALSGGSFAMVPEFATHHSAARQSGPFRY